MPVRSLNSVVLKWPDRKSVLTAARNWAVELRARDSRVESVWCVGSYARGDWGVGSDADILLLVDDTSLSLIERRRRYEPVGLPVPVDLWVYTRADWDEVARSAPLLYRRLLKERLVLA